MEKNTESLRMVAQSNEMISIYSSAELTVDRIDDEGTTPLITN